MLVPPNERTRLQRKGKSLITIKNATWPARRRPAILALFLAAFLLAGCRTAAPFAPANLSDASWKIHQGQALWTPQRGAPELAGELLVATQTGGRALAQFTKTPFPFVVAQVDPQKWQIEFVPQNRTINGPGTPPRRFGWLQLLPSLQGKPAAPPWTFQRDGEKFRLENNATGEIIDGFLQ